jgi:opacity protein-like surface antigen
MNGPFFFFAMVMFLACAAASAQTDVAASIYGAFSGTTTGNGVAQSPANAAGGMFELRHIANPIFGFEATYSFNRANQTYTSTHAVSPTCPTSGCTLGPVTVPADAHEITADWVPSLHIANLRPFGVLGVGLLLDVPSNSASGASTTTKPVYVYGAGLDWGVLPHLGLRFQYRGNLYKSPDLTALYTSTDTFTHTAEPMIGAYFRF